MKCRMKNKAGRPCSAPAVGNTKRCVMHSGRAAELGSKGGRRRTKFNPGELMPFSAPKNAADVGDLLAQSMVDVRNGQLQPRAAKSICDLASEFLKSLEVRTIEEVVEPMEQERDQARGFKDAPNGNQESS